MRKYVIRCGSRTGSTYLCDLLSSTNRCGRPKEYFNPSLSDSDFDNIDLYKFRKNIVQTTKTENDVAGIKVVGVNEQWNIFSKTGFDPKYWIRLYRKDTVMQAISRYRAWKTNEWVVRTKGDRKTILDSWRRMRYSRDGIQWCLDEIEQEESVFDNFFSDKNYIKIEYQEDLHNNPLQTVCSVLEFMNINTDELPEIKSNNTIIRTKKAEKWKDMFNNDRS